MAQRDTTSESAIFYGGVRRNHVTRPSKGSARTVKIHDDLRSNLVHELVEQLNEARVEKREALVIPDATTLRRVLVSSKYDLFIEDIVLLQGQTAALANAATDIRVAIAGAGDIDMQAGPATILPERGVNDGLFLAEGFGTNNLPGKTEYSLKDIDASLVDALSLPFPGPFVLRAGQALYVEVTNTEGAEITLEFRVDCAITDRLSLNPKDFSRAVTLPMRRFSRKDGRLN